MDPRHERDEEFGADPNLYLVQDEGVSRPGGQSAPSAAAAQIVYAFGFQSYLDDAALEKGIVDQGANAGGIVNPVTVNMQGHGLALMGSSQTPIAVEFMGDRGAAAGGAVVMKPGTTLRPIGARFQGFRWGLPYGWLGGGLANLLVLPTQSASIDHAGTPEVCFHRMRAKVNADTGVLPAAVKNWPRRFNVPQQGQPIIAVEPTRAFARLRLASPQERTIRMIFRGLADFDSDSGGVKDTTDMASPLYYDMTFPAQIAGAATVYPVIQLPEWVSRLGGDDASIFLSDLGDGGLTNQMVDFIRYGRL
jgi:hypothetical protein